MDAAEAVNRAPAARMLTAALVLVLGLLLAMRVGWLPS